MEQAAKHLPADAVRPAVILFTDGKHDVKGVPVSQVQPTRDRLFGSRTPFALLPVGMGLDPKERGALEAGPPEPADHQRHAAMRQRRDIRRGRRSCSRPPTQAGNAVAVALQDATCTFTVAATPPPAADARPPAVRGGRDVLTTPGDGQVEVAWTPVPPARAPRRSSTTRSSVTPATPRRIESTEGVSLDRTTVVTGPAPTGAPTTARSRPSAARPRAVDAGRFDRHPDRPPPAPGKPAVDRVGPGAADQRGAASPASRTLHYECSDDNGTTWPAVVDVATTDDPTTQVGDLANGSNYVCRAFAANAIGHERRVAHLGCRATVRLDARLQSDPHADRSGSSASRWRSGCILVIFTLCNRAGAGTCLPWSTSSTPPTSATGRGSGSASSETR